MMKTSFGALLLHSAHLLNVVHSAHQCCRICTRACRLAWYIANVPLVYRLLGFEVRQWAVALFVLGSIFLQGARMLRAVGPDPYQ